MFVGFQQFILGTEINKKIEPKIGVCLFCYTDSLCSHNIYDTYDKKEDNTFCKECVKEEVYSVCHLGHTMCGNCIYTCIENGLKYNGGKIKCVCFNTDQEIGGKKIKPCKELIDKEIVIQIFDELGIDQKEKEKLREKYIEMQNKLQNDILFLNPQNEKCKYEECMGYFDITKGFICNKDDNHKHCGNCFNKIHKGKCEDPLKSEVYKLSIQQNTEIHKKIKIKQLKNRDIEGYKPCPNCHQIIIKCEGCNHMTCGKDYGGNANDFQGRGCGYQWCWRCGKACFCNYPEAPGNNHYDIDGPCWNKQNVNKDPNNQNYFDDGDYFGIKNGKFKKQFEKLAREGVIDVEVETPTEKPNIEKIDWKIINDARKKYQEEQKKKHFSVDDIKNCCTECCCMSLHFSNKIIQII